MLYLTLSKGFFIGEIEAEYLDQDYVFLTSDEVQKSLQGEESIIFEHLRRASNQIVQHDDLRFQVLQNAFFSEDINKVYEIFGGDIYLIECVASSSYNYISFILTKEQGKLKICYLNCILDMQ